MSRSLMGRPRRLIEPSKTPNLTNHPLRYGWNLATLPNCPLSDTVRNRTIRSTLLNEPGRLLNERRLDEFTSRNLIAAQPFQSSLIRARRFFR